MIHHFQFFADRQGNVPNKSAGARSTAEGFPTRRREDGPPNDCQAADPVVPRASTTAASNKP
jgi:hypothetical protein